MIPRQKLVNRNHNALMVLLRAPMERFAYEGEKIYG
jgi:hypothetical protein